MNGEKVLITGGAGYIGSVLTEYLLSRGYGVTCIDNLLYGQKTPFQFVHHPRYTFINGDVRDRELMRKVLPSHSVIIPLAAIVGMPACNKNPKDAVSVNYEAIVLLNELRTFDQKVIYPNTNSGYGIGGEVYCTEESPLRPISLYGKTKCDAEGELLNGGKDSIVLRLATVFGTSPRMRTDLLVNDFVLRAKRDKFLVLFEKNFKRNYIHIRDVARCFEHCIINFSVMKNKAYNLGLDEANLSKLELAKKIKEHVPELVILESDFSSDPDKRDYIVSNKRIIASGFKTQYPLDLGIKELLKGYEVLLSKDLYANV